MKAVLFAFVCAVGCMVGESGPIDRTGGDTTGDDTGGEDTGAAAACTGAVYDPCTDPGQCESGMCQAFEQDGIQVCTQTCTPGDSTTCPQLNGQPATCNNRGICKPPGANSCAP